ncbi:hypothetical protein ABZ313_35670 [Streptomyces sp. NPDC006251]|uniref:hypothetical protein n=1 Tax=Streptomyces sp. NPDC006251 TaxID=3155718 RepID=UPI0033BD3DA5
MPKSQSRFAGVARQIQTIAGIRYTDALRLLEPDRNELVLAEELRTAGHADVAAALTGVTLICTESIAWYDAFGEVESVYYETDPQRVKQVGEACRGAAEAVMRRVGFPEVGYAPEAEVYHAAFVALCLAGAVPDGRRLARAAIGVLDADPLMCSDIVRSRGRRPFTYRNASDLTGPGTATAVAARKAARAMAAASRVPQSGDEQWYEAAELMVGAVWHGCVAAGRPPLHNRTAFQDFYRMEMDGPVDDYPDPAGR